MDSRLSCLNLASTIGYAPSTFFWSKVDLNRVAKLYFKSKKYTFQKFNIFDFQISTYLNHLFCTFVHRSRSFWTLQWFLYGSEGFKVVLFLSIIDFEPTDLRLSHFTVYKSARRRRAGCFCVRSNALCWLSVAAKDSPAVSGSIAITTKISAVSPGAKTFGFDQHGSHFSAPSGRRQEPKRYLLSLKVAPRMSGRDSDTFYRM